MPWRRVFVIALVAALTEATETEHRQALADGFQPAMMVMAAPCVVAAIVTEPFVSDGGTAAPPARTAAKMPRLRPAGPAPAAAT